MNEKIVLFSSVGEEGFKQMPLPVMSIGSTLHQEGYKVVLIDIQTEHDWRRKLKDNIRDALYVGISCMTGPSIFEAIEAAKITRKLASCTPIVWGGYFASAFFNKLFDEGLADYVIRGPGEVASIMLSQYLVSNKELDITQIPNLTYSIEDQIKSNPFQMITDMDTLPRMNYDLIDVEQYYYTNVRSQTQRRFYYVSSYGCPSVCAFCSEKTHTHQCWQGFSAERVYNDLVYFDNKYKPDRIQIVDPCFSTNPKRVAALAQMLLENNIHIKMMCDMRIGDILKIAKLIDLRLLREAGLEKLYTGIETGSNRVLKALYKNFSKNDALLACELLDQAGIMSHVSIVHDFPFETIEDSNETFELCEQLASLKTNRQFHRIYTPFYGTSLYEELVQNSDLNENFTLHDWAKTTIDGCTNIWSGRKWFRENVLNKVNHLKDRYPTTFKHQPDLQV